VNRAALVFIIFCGVVATVGLAQVFGLPGLLTGIIGFWIAKPVLEDML
jgi:hypothetical protein